MIDKEEFTKKMIEICNSEEEDIVMTTELNHLNADRLIVKLLRSLDFTEAADEYEKHMNGEWWYA